MTMFNKATKKSLAGGGSVVVGGNGIESHVLLTGGVINSKAVCYLETYFCVDGVIQSLESSTTHPTIAAAKRWFEGDKNPKNLF